MTTFVCQLSILDEAADRARRCAAAKVRGRGGIGVLTGDLRCSCGNISKRQ